MRCTIRGKNGLKRCSLNRRRAIRRHCLACSDFDWAAVVGCRRFGCPLFAYRPGGSAAGGGLDAEARGEAIRHFCRACRDGNSASDCAAEDCALFGFRR